VFEGKDLRVSRPLIVKETHMDRRTFLLAAAVAASAPAMAETSVAPGLALGPSGRFAFLPAPGAPFSGAVIARPGFHLRRLTLRQSRPLEEGLAFAAAYLKREGLAGALAGVELRSPVVLSRADFAAFNVRYVAALKAVGLVSADVVPAARSNMAPVYDVPATAQLHAFTIAAPGPSSPDALGPDFLISGKPAEGPPPMGVIAPNDVSSEGMAKKAAFVIAALKAATLKLGGHWEDVTGVHIYTRQALGGALRVLGDSGLAQFDLALVPGDPPSTGADGTPTDFEADVRAVSEEVII
jgi:hypothetical protein